MSGNAKKYLVVFALLVVSAIIAHTMPVLHGDGHSIESCPACVLLTAFILLLIVAAIKRVAKTSNALTFIVAPKHFLLDSLLSQRGPPAIL